MTNDFKQKFGETTEQVENKIRETFATYHPYYRELEPWKRGLILIALTLFLLFAIYYLTQPTKNLKQSSKQEALAEERLLRQMAFFKRLRE